MNNLRVGVRIRKGKLIPSCGNEGNQHLDAKDRLEICMKDLGFKNIEMEKYLPYPYYFDKQQTDELAPVDIYGEFPQTGIKLAVQVDGKKGHNSYYKSKKAAHRKRYLKEKEDIKIISLPASNFDKDMPDDVIKAELLEAVLR